MDRIDVTHRDENGTALSPEVGLPYLWSYWEGPIPPAIELCLQTLRKHNPTFRLVTPESLKDLGGEHILAATAGLSAAHRSDLVRLWLVAEWGGVWVDADSIAFQPLDLLTIVARYQLVCVRNRFQKRGYGREALGAPFGASARSPYILWAMKECELALSRMRAGEKVPYGSTSAGLMGRLWLKTQGENAIRFDHWKYYRIPWYDAGRTFRRRNRLDGHEFSKDWNPAAQLYHLSNLGIRPFRGWCKKRILNSATFLGFLLNKSLGNVGKGVLGRSFEILKRLPTNGPIVGAEVGVFIGRNSRHLLQQRGDLSVNLVDVWNESPFRERYASTGDAKAKLRDGQWKRVLEMAQHNLRFAGERAIFRKGDSRSIARTFKDASLDFVFIDAEHSYEACIADIDDWLPKVRAGGFIGGHDYRNSLFPGVTRAVEELARLYSMTTEIGVDSTWFWRVTEAFPAGRCVGEALLRQSSGTENDSPESATGPYSPKGIELEELWTNLAPALRNCMKAGKYMFAAFRIEDDNVVLQRTTRDFPSADFSTALEVLSQDLRAEAERIDAM